MTTFWLFLIPEAGRQREYNKIIKSFSEKYGTPEIDAHVTLMSVPEAEEKDLLTKVARIAKDFSKLEVEVLGMNFSNTITQCVFAQLKMSTQLLSLY